MDSYNCRLRSNRCSQSFAIHVEEQKSLYDFVEGTSLILSNRTFVCRTQFTMLPTAYFEGLPVFSAAYKRLDNTQIVGLCPGHVKPLQRLPGLLSGDTTGRSPYYAVEKSQATVCSLEPVDCS